MSTREGKPHEVVIELRSLPAFGRMAIAAVGRELGLLVIGVPGGLVDTHMAAGAVLRRTGIAPGDMTLIAAQLRMCPRQGKLCARDVVKCCADPGQGVMARGTVVGESGFFVGGISCAREISGMAAETIGRCSGEPCRMAVCTFETPVRSFQGEPGIAYVVEACTPP